MFYKEHLFLQQIGSSHKARPKSEPLLTIFMLAQRCGGQQRMKMFFILLIYFLIKVVKSNFEHFTLSTYKFLDDQIWEESLLQFLFHIMFSYKMCHFKIFCKKSKQWIEPSLNFILFYWCISCKNIVGQDFKHLV